MDEQIEDRSHEQHTVKAVCQTAVSGHDLSIVFYALLPLDDRKGQVAEYTHPSSDNAEQRRFDADDKGKRDPADHRIDNEHAKKDHGVADESADKSFHGLFR